MAEINAEFIERYQILYQKDPNSRVFAPLAEAYRKMGLTEEALRICEKGVEKHPHFPSGRVAYAKVLMDYKRFQAAKEQLTIATELSPENILAHQLLGDCLQQLKEYKLALKAYKMLLFLNPNDERILQQVKKLESLTADEYDEEVFEMRRLPETVTEKSTPTNLEQQKILDRHISLIDAFLTRNDSEKALFYLEKARQEVGLHPELQKRLKLLKPEKVDSTPKALPSELREDRKKIHKIQLLEKLLLRVGERRKQEKNLGFSL